MSNQGVVYEKVEMSYNNVYLKWIIFWKKRFEGGFKSKLIYKN